VVEGPVSPRAQDGLRDTLRAQGCFLACRYYPTADLTVAKRDEAFRTPARILSLDWLSETVLRVRFRAERPFAYHAGQFVNLIRADGLTRSYSLASLPSEDAMETHVRILPNGAMSQWLLSAAQPGTAFSVEGPLGDCFYVPEHQNEPLLLAGAGAGLAPLHGIARDALTSGHTGPVWLLHGAVEAGGLYLTNELRELATSHPNFHYVPVVLRGDVPDGGKPGALDDVIAAEFPSLNGWRAYVCGDPDLVQSMRRKMFLAGAEISAIHADLFLPSGAAST
jgi:CDP-4-dehydro-6-deoxyglucose reductase